MFRNKLKKFMGLIFGAETAYVLSRHLYFRKLFPFVQAVIYHHTPDGEYLSLRKQFEWYKENFVNCSLSELRELITNGEWRYDKPGLIISFDDGLRSNFDVALSLLEEFGFTGWFMIPAGFVDLESSKQIEFARRSLIDCDVVSCNDRIALSWEEAREIERRGHVVTCHSMNHKRLSEKLSQHELEIEIKEAKDLLELRLGHVIDIFTWVGGEELAYGRRAYDLIVASGFESIFCTNCAPITAKQSPLFLQRYHVDPKYNRNQLRFVLGGFYDLMYAWKRRRILNNLTLKSHT